jgi:hypothetical protein
METDSQRGYVRLLQRLAYRSTATVTSPSSAFAAASVGMHAISTPRPALFNRMVSELCALIAGSFGLESNPSTHASVFRDPHY